MNIKIPNDVYKILKILNDAGYESYVVGGAVRDAVLGNEPHDWDITTNATPDQVKKLFKKTIDTGLQHGTVTAMLNSVGYEITTYRIDGEYEDNRRPSSVEFTTDLSKDLQRRDITFNAMAMDKEGNIVDLYNGIQDLKDGIVRSVGDPNERIQEDALRMLRAIRFSARYGFHLDEDFRNAIKKNAHLIKNVSYERIESEVTKIITSNNPEQFLELYNLGLTQYILPEFDKMMNCEQNTIWHNLNVGMHTIEALKHIDNDPNLRWSILLHDVGKPFSKSTDENGKDHFYNHPEKSEKISDSILKRYKKSTNDSTEIKKLIFYHDLYGDDLSMIRKFVALEGIDFARKLIKLQLADVEAQSDYKKEEKINNIKKLSQLFEQVYQDKTAITLKELKVNGNDLLELGYKGKEIGLILSHLYEQTLRNPSLNDKNILLDIVNKIDTLDNIIEKKNEKITTFTTTNKDICNTQR